MNDPMKNTYNIAGFTIVLDKITMISAVFQARNDEGWQFNIRLVSGDFLPVKRPDRAKATLDRELLVRAINEQKDGLRFPVSGKASLARQAPTPVEVLVADAILWEAHPAPKNSDNRGWKRLPQKASLARQAPDTRTPPIQR